MATIWACLSRLDLSLAQALGALAGSMQQGR